MGAGRRVIILFVLTFLYLFLGAVIFSAIESAHETKIKLNLYNHLTTFVERNPCINVSEFNAVLEEVWYAASIGVDLTAEHDNTSAPTTRWDLANAFFFSTTIITTIGYGHLSPATPSGQNFCIVYAYLGIPLIAVLLTEISSKWKQHLTDVGSRINTHLLNVIQQDGVRKAAIITILIIPAYVLVIILPAAVFSYLEGWDFSTSHYYCFISLSTIGFGDYVATQINSESKVLVWIYKIGTSMYLIVGLGIMAIVFQGLQTKRKRYSVSKTFVKMLRRRRKPWLQMMEEQADILHNRVGDPLETVVVSTAVAAAAVATGLQRETGQGRAKVPLDALQSDSCGSSGDDDSDGNDSDGDDHEEESLIDQWQDDSNATASRNMDISPSGDFLDPDDEEEIPFIFQSVIARHNASLTPDSDGAVEVRPQPRRKVQNTRHSRSLSLPLTRQGQDHHPTLSLNTEDEKPDRNSLKCDSPLQRDGFGDSKAENSPKSTPPKRRLISASSSFTAEDSGIHAVSSQSTIDMESTV